MDKLKAVLSGIAGLLIVLYGQLHGPVIFDMLRQLITRGGPIWKILKAVKKFFEKRPTIALALICLLGIALGIKLNQAWVKYIHLEVNDHGGKINVRSTEEAGYDEDILGVEGAGELAARARASGNWEQIDKRVQLACEEGTSSEQIVNILAFAETESVPRELSANWFSLCLLGTVNGKHVPFELAQSLLGKLMLSGASDETLASFLRDYGCDSATESYIGEKSRAVPRYSPIDLACNPKSCDEYLTGSRLWLSVKSARDGNMGPSEIVRHFNNSIEGCDLNLMDPMTMLCVGTDPIGVRVVEECENDCDRHFVDSRLWSMFKEANFTPSKAKIEAFFSGGGICDINFDDITSTRCLERKDQALVDALRHRCEDNERIADLGTPQHCATVEALNIKMRPEKNVKMKRYEEFTNMELDDVEIRYVVVGDVIDQYGLPVVQDGATAIAHISARKRGAFRDKVKIFDVDVVLAEGSNDRYYLVENSPFSIEADKVLQISDEIKAILAKCSSR